MPSTPIYSFPYPANTDLVRDAHQDVEDLATAVENKLDTINGIVPVVPTGVHTNISFSDVGVGTPSVGASTFTIGGAFSTQYDAYRITWNGATSTANETIRVTYPSITTGYYGNLIYNRPNNNTPFTIQNNNSDLHNWIGWCGQIIMDFEVYCPAQSNELTYIHGRYYELNQLSGAALGTYNGWITSTSSVTSIIITLGAGTISNSGKLRIYAYNR